MHSPLADAPPHLHALLQRQRAAFVREGPPNLRQRRADLQRLRSAVLAHRVPIAQALQQDFGHRSTHETAIMELMPLIQAIDDQCRHLRRWMRPTRRPVALHFQPGRAWVQYQPLGVVGILSPWNYPLQLALLPLATALAAGNRALIKPSEFTPATSALLQTLLAQTFPDDQVAVITGDAATGQAFASLPLDHLVFTGSTRVGRAVMQAASANLVPVTLELGGKSPAIVDAGHPLAHAAQAIAYGKLANAGQTCIAPDYVLVPQAQVDDFATAYDAAVRALYPAGPTSADYTAVVNAHQYQRLTGLLDDAQAKGAALRAVGAHPDTAAQRPHTLAPMVVLNTSDEMALMHEEIFGPVLPIVPYQSLDDAIGYVNARPRPLALYFFGHDADHQRQVLARTTSGNVTVNNTLLHYAQQALPFGGVGESGMGAYHGIDGFKALSHAKGVFQQGRWNLSGMLRPPYGNLADRILQFLLR